MQALIDDLAEKVNQGTASDKEYAEYASIVAANNLIAVLKAKLRRTL